MFTPVPGWRSPSHIYGTHVLELTKAGIYGNNKWIRDVVLYFLDLLLKVNCMYGLIEGSVNRKQIRCQLLDACADQGTQTVTCRTVSAYGQEHRLAPAMGVQFSQQCCQHLCEVLYSMSIIDEHTEFLSDGGYRSCIYINKFLAEQDAFSSQNAFL